MSPEAPKKIWNADPPPLGTEYHNALGVTDGRKIPGSDLPSPLKSDVAWPSARSDWMALSAITMPAPELRSTPAAWMSTTLLRSAARICIAVADGFFDFIRAAIAAACGAAADVPKNGEPNPPTPVTDTPSAAVMSGLLRTCPPLDDTLPGVIAAPVDVKKMCRGPSELNGSVTLAELNGFGYGPVGYPVVKGFAAGVAATLNDVSDVVSAWPCVLPAVAIDSRPRFVSRCRNRAAPENLTTTIRSPATPPFMISNGSCEPFCTPAEKYLRVVPVESSRKIL